VYVRRFSLSTAASAARVPPPLPLSAGGLLKAGRAPAKPGPALCRGAIMRALLDVILLVLQLYTYIIIAVAILSWLIAFHVVNIHNDFVRSVWNGLNALTEPLLRPIRRWLPNFSGLDVSPIILLLIIFFIERIIEYYLYPAFLRF
jgi:YggT family protein